MRTFLKGLGWTLVILPLFYLWLGFLAVPGLGLLIGNQLLERYTTEPTRLQRLEFNPVSLELRLWDFRMGEQPLLALAEARAQLSWQQLFQGRIHLRNVHLQQPHAHIELDEERRLTLLAALILPEAAEPKDEPQQEPFPFTLELARIEQGSLFYKDRGLRQPVEMQFSGLQAELHDLSLDSKDAATFRLQLAAADGTAIKTNGSFALHSLDGSGALQVEGLQLASWWPYVTEELALHLQQGQLQLAGNYRLELQPQLQLQVDTLDLQLDNLALSDADSNALLRLARLDISQAGMDLAARQAGVAAIRVQQLQTPLVIDENSQLNWQKIAPAGTAEPATPASDNSGFKLADIPWHLRLQTLDISDSTLELSLLNQPEPFNLELNSVSLQASGFDSRSNEPLNLQLGSRLGEQGTINLSAAIAQQTLTGTANLKTRDIDLRMARPWIKPYARIELLSAFLNTDLNASIKSLQELAFALDGQLQLRQLHARDQDQNRDLLKWSNLQLEQLAFSMSPDASVLNIGRIRADEPYARLVINENLETNISQLMIPQPDTAPAGNDPSAPFSFSIGEILVNNGSANFADFSLQPHFATAIQKLNGRIGKLASDSQKTTPVEITGAVDNYAPVRISGSLTPFDPLQQLDITTEFKRVELTALTPYSGKFAGYRIQKGRLNMELHYQVNQGQLNASNSVLLEQLQLGEKVESADAVDLPVRMAIAMLKDTKGDISIQLPVKGDLNSPEFSVMPIVWQTLRNLLTRAVSSPFRMLAGIGKAGDRDLGQIPFSPGNPALQEEASAMLDSLAEALQQRPMLKLNIEGTSAATLDGPALAERVLHRRYQELLYRQLQERGKPLPDDVYSLEVPVKSTDKLLTHIYESLLEEGKVEAMPAMPRKERHDWQRRQVLAQMAGDPLYLRWLAQQRAAAIRSHLVEQGGVDVERLYLLDVNEKAEADEGVVLSQLHLDVL